MARMADSFMKGYSFVDNVKRKHRADDRLVTLQDRQDEQYANQQTDRQVRLADADVARGRVNTAWGQQQDDRAKKQAEAKVMSEYSGKLFSLMSKNQKELYEKGVASLPPEAQGEKGKAVIADAVMNPDKISRAISSWDNNILPAFQSGNMPDKKNSLDVMNTVLHPEIQGRFGKNGLSGKLTDIVPTPDGKGLYFEAAVKDAYGREYNAPITDGAGSANEPDSGKHEMQNMPVGDTMKHTADAVETYRQILEVLASDGGSAGRELAFKILKSKQDSQTELAKYNRDRRDKKTDDDAKFKRDKKLAAIKSSGKSEKKSIYKNVKDSDGNIIAVNQNDPSDKQVVSISPTTKQAWQQDALAEATQWASDTATYTSLDSTDFKDYGGDEKKAVQIKAKELYGEKVNAFMAQNNSGPSSSGMAAANGPVVVGNTEDDAGKKYDMGQFRIGAAKTEGMGAVQKPTNTLSSAVSESAGRAISAIRKDRPGKKLIDMNLADSSNVIARAVSKTPALAEYIGNAMMSGAKAVKSGYDQGNLMEILRTKDIPKIKRWLSKYPEAVGDIYEIIQKG